MIKEEYTISLGSYREENALRGTVAFPCAAYHGDVQNFVSGQIIPHWHRDIEWFVLLSGHIRIALVDGEYDLYAGNGYLLNSNALHGVSCQTQEPCRYRSIVFDPAIVAGVSGSVFETAYMRPFMESGKSIWLFDTESGEDTAVKDLFLMAYEAFRQEPRGYEFIVRDALSRMLLLVMDDAYSAKKQTAIQDHRVKQVLSWLDQHYKERVTIEQIAENAGVSVRECQRVFSVALHDSPTKYLLRRRVSAAAELLAKTNASMSEIALQCGFDSASYFSKQFKAITGMTPREYRTRYTV